MQRIGKPMREVKPPVRGRFFWRLASLLSVVGLVVAPATWAHHSFGYFNMSKNVLYEGTVLKYQYGNPHTHIVVVVMPGAKDPSTVGTWDIEAASVNIMARQGWNRNSFKPGDHIKAVAHPMKDGSKGASLFYVILPNGQRRYQDIARPKAGEVLPN
jgi:hypothetical protein